MITTSVTVRHWVPSASFSWLFTVDDPLTLARLSLCQLEVVPTPPRIASFVAAAACCCSLQSSSLVIASERSEDVGSDTPATLEGAPARSATRDARPPRKPPIADLFCLAAALWSQRCVSEDVPWAVAACGTSATRSRSEASPKTTRNINGFPLRYSASGKPMPPARRRQSKGAPQV